MRLYGLIGFPLTHSFSKSYFEQKFANEGIVDCAFENFPIKNIEEVKQLVADNNLKGFAITIPYKKKIIRFLDDGSEAVKQMVACNCVKISNGRLIGFNTDVVGFRQSFIRKLQPHHTKALILGTGGAADAVAYVLKKLGIEYLFVSRSKRSSGNILYSSLDRQLLKEYPIIINCTPVGTFPNADECPSIPYDAINDQHYLFDLVYNPSKTKFLSKGEEKGAVTCNGYEMLVLQAEENWKIWNS